MVLKFKFQKQPPSGDPHAIIPIRIINPSNNLSFDTNALMDCGASRNLFPASVATVLGIKNITDTEWSVQKFGDASGRSMLGYPHKMILEVGGTYRFETVIYFSKDIHEDALLLGINGFFSHFVVKIDVGRNSIELTPVVFKK